MERTSARLADRPTAGARTWIDATPEQVWPVVSDIALLPAASTELQAVEWLDGAAGPRLGARFHGHNRNDLLGEWTTTSHVVECEPGRAFGWAVADPEDPIATWRFALAPRDGGTDLEYAVRLGTHRSGLTAAIERKPEAEEEFVRRRLGDLERNMTATLDHLKRLAEAR
ncbi:MULTISPECIES: SRPBCC family protein [unclassified Saccharopolyspora]|uniref:SRPBCC family protein n=1 Tax=unclassified Saccharopolyspora TaxID=2646250 RepID=UPI001CD569F0|nr:MULTISPECIES: SRPBCC family protein [unclassified Saccharopolyspora]MCA1188570.1 SRPBCC family protein [Saccharopolyspora sp. 6T]MCA1193049.1 SRPBCC family protein [Saccharopolyspora sp. 6V]MCA1228815.1 SRPBCC family protein [Saccharopolyspora sp. 6M]MCA1283288.1 SRPBCC family protein [Saccharopolyspora sp. 7B]